MIAFEEQIRLSRFFPRVLGEFHELSLWPPRAQISRNVHTVLFVRRYGGGYGNSGGTTVAAAAASLVVDTFAAYAAAATSSVVQAGAGGSGPVPPPYDAAATSSNYVADSTTPAASSTTPSSATSTYGSDMEVSSVAAAVPGETDNLMASVSGSTAAVSSGQNRDTPYPSPRDSILIYYMDWSLVDFIDSGWISVLISVFFFANLRFRGLGPGSKYFESFGSGTGSFIGSSA